MVRTVAVLVFPLCVAACAAVPGWVVPAAPNRGGGDTGLAYFRFDWQLSGDRVVAPLQVFDDGHRIWLQFAPGQPVPAIFEHTAHGERPVSYIREGPYIVLPGLWDALMFRGGALQAMARRTASQVADAQQSGVASMPVTSPPIEEQASAPAAEPMHGAIPMLAGDAPLPLSTATALPVVDVESDPVPLESYDVSPRDMTLRGALVRWAGRAGWTFEPEHWTVDADIPIVGTASFSLPFKPAVQALVASTELADKPLQPCFYSNRVLRIVPYAQPCDRTVGAAGVL